jgi:hypothetical protein
MVGLINKKGKMGKKKETKKTVTTTVTTTVVTETTAVKPTQIVMVLDRSGSMDSISQPTVDGINSFIKEQKAAEGEASMTLVQFDNEYEITYKERPLNEVLDLINGETFVPRATTALYDAVGRTINELKTTDDVVFVIVTDGFENASREFTQKMVFDKIEEKKKSGWNFIFLGANQDAISAGSAIGISANNSINFNANVGSVNASYMSLSGKLGKFRSAKMSANYSVAQDSLNFDDQDRKDLNV